MTTTMDSYRRVQTQTSVDAREDNETETDPVEIIPETSKPCECTGCKQSIISSKCVKAIVTLSVVALLISLAAVSMVIFQWTYWDRPAKCICPKLDTERINIQDGDLYDPISADSPITDGPMYDLSTSAEDGEDCGPCRVRRENESQGSPLGSRSSPPRHGRRRKCHRACLYELDTLRSDMLSQVSSSAIHFHGFPPALYDLGEDGAYKCWRPATWYSNMTGFYYNHSSGHVTVREPGLYFIYSQVQHPILHSQAHALMINHSVFLRCIKSAMSSGGHSTHDQTSCYVAGVTVLQKNDQIWIKGTHTNGKVSVQEQSSYWGIIRLRTLSTDIDQS